MWCDFILQLLVYIARSSVFCGIKSQLPILFIYLRQKLPSIVSSPLCFLLASVFVFCLGFLDDERLWYLFCSTAHLTLTHTLQQKTASHCEFQLPLSLRYISRQSVCTWAEHIARVTSILSLIYHLCIVLIFSHSLPLSSLTSSHPSLLIIIFCPEVEFLHHLFCHLHHSLLFSLSILPPCLLSMHPEATKSLTGTQYIGTVLSRHYHIRSTAFPVMQLVYSNCLCYSLFESLLVSIH